MYNEINYSSNYKKIISVEINHRFFSSNKCNAFKIKPDLQTTHLFKNYGIVFKETAFGFVLICGGDARYSSVVFNGHINIVLLISCKDPLFLNYTDLSINNGWGLAFNNSFKTNILHKNEFVDKDAMAYLNTGLLDGEIRIKLNDENEFFGVNSVGNFEMEKKFFIKFNSRRIIVRYNFYSNKKDFEFSKYFITDEENSFKNNAVLKRRLSNGRAVYSIENKSSIESSEFYESNYFLKKDDNFFNSFSVQLPHPEPKNFSFDKNVEKFYGDVFVSLN